MTKSRGIRVRRGTRASWAQQEQGHHFCGCGCGSPIEIRPEHFNVGIPRYAVGHNTRTANPNPHAGREKPAAEPCACGCGALATPGKRFISGHNSLGRPYSAETRQKLSASKVGQLNPRYGKQPANYRGGFRTADGYIMRPVKDHPFAPHGKMFEHRLVVERHLRKTDPDSPYLTEVNGVSYLRPDIQIHHIDGVRDHNKIGNLQPMTPAEHTRWHQRHRHPHK